MDYKWVKLSRLAYFEKFELNIPSDRIFLGLSEYHKIIEIRPTELKIWPVEDHDTDVPVATCSIIVGLVIITFTQRVTVTV